VVNRLVVAWRDSTGIEKDMGKIIRAYGWDEGPEQRFLTINPLADEVSIYQTKPSQVSVIFSGVCCNY